MKKYKIYEKGNYIYIVDVEKTEFFRGSKKEVFVDKSSLNKPVYRIFNVKDWKDTFGIELSNILKENGTPYTEEEFDTFYETFTQVFNSPKGGAVIEVGTLPIEDIRQDVLYKVGDVTYWYNGTEWVEICTWYNYTPENVSNKATTLSSPNNTTYPTTQAVASAIAAQSSVIKVFNKTPYSYTGTAATMILGTPLLIPANTFKNLDSVVVRGIFSKQGNNDTYTLSIYLSPVPNLTTDNVIWVPTNGFVNNKDSNSYTVTTAPYLIEGGNIYGSFGGAEVATNNYTLNCAPAIPSNYIFDPTIDNYLFATSVLSTGVDTFTQKFLQIETI